MARRLAVIVGASLVAHLGIAAWAWSTDADSGMLAEPRFLGPLLVVLACQLAILSWVASSAFTLAGMGVSVDAYGWMFAGVMLGQITGAWAASRLVVRLGMARLMRSGSSLGPRVAVMTPADTGGRSVALSVSWPPGEAEEGGTPSSWRRCEDIILPACVGACRFIAHCLNGAIVRCQNDVS